MYSSADLSDSILNIESYELTHTASGGVRDVSGLDHSVDLRPDCLSYEWVYPRILDVPTCFRGPNALDKFLSKVSILKPNSPLDALAVDIRGHNQESASLDFFLYRTHFLTIYLSSSPLMNLPWGPSDP